MKKMINLNFILRKFFDPKLITISIFLSLIISTTSFFFQENFKVFIVDIYFKNNIKNIVYLNEINKLKLNKNSELSIQDILKLQYMKSFPLSDDSLFLELKANLVPNELKKIENKLNGKIELDRNKQLNNSNFLTFKFTKKLDYGNQENTYYDNNSIRLIEEDTTVIVNQYVSEFLKNKVFVQDYLNEKDFVIVHISSFKEYKFNFFRLFSTFIFISLFINLIFVLLKFRKTILI
jgi:hypothetical protein